MTRDMATDRQANKWYGAITNLTIENNNKLPLKNTCDQINVNLSGLSYNPDVKSHRKLLEKAAVVELKRSTKAKADARQKTVDFPKVREKEAFALEICHSEQFFFSFIKQNYFAAMYPVKPSVI